MKTKDELNALREEVESLSKKLAELSEEELMQVTGGFGSDYDIVWEKSGDEVDNPTEAGTYHAGITIHDDGPGIWTSEQFPAEAGFAGREISPKN